MAFYTSFNHDAANGNQSVRAVYSKDNGRTWAPVQAAPVVENPGGPDGGWDFRDPKVTWDAASGKWIMVVAGGDHLRFHTSTDLVHWTFTSAFGYGDWVRGGVWECPDFFELPVEGQPGVKRWVLWWSTGAVRPTNGSAAQYVTGTWNGTALHRGHRSGAGPAGRLRPRLLRGHELLRGPGRPAHHAGLDEQLGLCLQPAHRPVERAAERPAAAQPEGRSRRRTPAWTGTGGRTGRPADVHMAGVRRCRHAHISQPAGGSLRPVLRAGSRGGDPVLRRRLGLHLRAPEEARQAATAQETLLRYAAGAGAGAGTLTLDRGQSGRADFTRYFAGAAADNSSTAWSSETVAASGGGTERRVKLRALVDSSSVEVFGGDGTAAITSLVFPDPGSTGLSFSTSGGTPGWSPRKSTSWRTRRASPGAPPSAVLPAATGTARHNLGSYSVVPGGRWEGTGAGLAGTFDKDSTAMSAATYSDVRVAATVRFGGVPYAGAMLNSDQVPGRGYGGAGSVLLRASADGSTAYYVNLDPNLRLARIFKLQDGVFNPSGSVLASVPLLLSHGVSYRVEAQAAGERLTVKLDGAEILAVDDASLTSGRVGLNVFDGRAAYQDVLVTGSG